jgi:GNAT superfamily N-acetyltransferase
MLDVDIKFIGKQEILTIIPLLKFLNSKTPDDLLKLRLPEMAEQNYLCAGMYHNTELIGICGIWLMTRHYIGRSAEVDHVVIHPDYRNQQLGKKFFGWIHDQLKEMGCEAVELNTYADNRKSHKFYYNEGYEIYGFHMLKILREDAAFY